jgi:hypothetical protein
MVIYSGADFFLQKRWSFLDFQRHQRNVAMDSRLASGCPEERKESKTEAKEFALCTKVSNLKYQGGMNQAAFAKGQRKNR